MARDWTLQQDQNSPVRTYRVPQTPERIVHYPGMAQEAMKRITAALSGQMTVDALLAWCEEADARWPLIGWRAAAEQLRRLPTRTPGVRTLGGQARQAAYEKIVAQERATLTPFQRETRARLLGMDGKPVEPEVPF